MLRVSGRRGRRGRPEVEGLEDRRLLAALVDVSTVLPIGAGEIVTGPDGNLWYTSEVDASSTRPPVSAQAIATYNPTSHVATTFTLPTANLFTISPFAPPQPDIVAGPDGNLYFTETVVGKIGRIDPTTHAISEYFVPGGVAAGLTIGPDGNLWFTEPESSKVGEFNLTTHAFAEFDVPYGYESEAIVPGPDGNLWFTGNGFIGRINLTTHAITEFPAEPKIDSLEVSRNSPTGIVSAGGLLWFSSTGIDSIDPATGTVATYPVVSNGNAQSPIGPLTVGPDGNVWFTSVPVLSGSSSQPQTASLGEIDVTSHAIQLSPILDVATTAYPGALTTGPGDYLWIADGFRIDRARLIPTGQAAIQGKVVTANGQGPDPSFIAGQNSPGPQGGATVYLDLKGDGRLDPGDPTAVTDANGVYTFTGLTPGTYTPRLVTYPGDLVTGAATAVTVAGGSLMIPAAFGVTPATGLLPLPAPPTGNPAGTRNPDLATAETIALYRQVLGRAPDPSGEAAAVAALNGKTLTTAGLAAALFGSDEYHISLVTADYRTILGRAASAVEIDANLGALRSGTTPERLAAALMTSAEFAILHPDSPSFIRAVYGAVLGRSASAGEVSGVAALMAGGLTRLDVVDSLLGSFEAAGRAANGFYEEILGRVSDAPGFAYWVTQLVDGETLADVAADFLGSPEYADRVKSTVPG